MLSSAISYASSKQGGGGRRNGGAHRRRISGPQRDKQKLHGNKETGGLFGGVGADLDAQAAPCRGVTAGHMKGDFPAAWLCCSEESNCQARRGMGSEEESGGLVAVMLKYSFPASQDILGGRPAVNVFS